MSLFAVKSNNHVNRTVFCYALLRISFRYSFSQKFSTKNCQLHRLLMSTNTSIMAKSNTHWSQSFRTFSAPLNSALRASPVPVALRY